jgi:putative NADH-flavin reductase
MKLFLLGSTGKAGAAILDESLRRGHNVTAFVRAPSKLTHSGRNLRVIEGDVLQCGTLSADMTGHDAVISSLSPGTFKRSRLQRRFAETVVPAMQRAEVRRLLILSVAFLFDGGGLLPLIFGNTFFRNIKEGAGEMEAVVKQSGLNWTIARLPRLTAGPSRGSYQVRPNCRPPSLSISNGSLACFVLDEIERNEYVKTTVGVSA